MEKTSIKAPEEKAGSDVGGGTKKGSEPAKTKSVPAKAKSGQGKKTGGEVIVPVYQDAAPDAEGKRSEQRGAAGPELRRPSEGSRGHSRGGESACRALCCQYATRCAVLSVRDSLGVSQATTGVMELPRRLLRGVALGFHCVRERTCTGRDPRMSYGPPRPPSLTSHLRSQASASPRARYHVGSHVGSRVAASASRQGRKRASKPSWLPSLRAVDR